MKKVLLADDDQFCRQALASFFKDNGYHITSVDNGNDAYGALVEQNYDLFLCDVHIPGKACDDIIHELHTRGIDLPFILMTGDGSEETEYRARKLSPAFYFVKPINLPDLKAVVEKAIKNYGAEYSHS